MKKHKMGLEKKGSRRIISVVTMSSDNMNHGKTEPYKLNRRLYLLIGLWPYEHSSKRYVRAYIVSLFLCGAILIQTYLLIASVVKMHPCMDLMTMYLPTVCFSACYYNILFHLDGVRNIQNRINSDFNNLINEEEWKAMKKYVHQNRIYSIMIVCVFYLFVGLLFVPSIRSLYLDTFSQHNGTVLVLPMNIEFYRKTRIRYIFMLLIEFLGACVISTVGIAYYSMVIACLQHACALFTIVTIKIEQSLKEKVDSNSTTSSTEQRREHDGILSVIKYYNDAIDFVGLLTAICTRTYFIEVIFALLFLVTDFLQFFRMLDMVMTRNEVMKNMIFTFGTIMMIYTAFFMGQRLIDHSVRVYTQCCQIPFYALSIKTQKLLVILIMRSLKPCSININGMMVTSHEVFAKIANASYSFAIVCYKMR